MRKNVSLSFDIPFSKIISLLAASILVVIGFQLLVPSFVSTVSPSSLIEKGMNVLFLLIPSLLLGSSFYFLAWKLRADPHVLVSASLFFLILVSMVPLFVEEMRSNTLYLNSVVLGFLLSLLIYVGEVEYEESRKTK